MKPGRPVLFGRTHLEGSGTPLLREVSTPPSGQVHIRARRTNPAHLDVPRQFTMTGAFRYLRVARVYRASRTPNPDEQGGDGAFSLRRVRAIDDLQRHAPGPARGRIATKNPSAPVLSATGSRQARISSVQARPSPATSAGWATIACHSLLAAAWRGRPLRASADAKKAIARAIPCKADVAKFGAEQPSIPKPGLVRR